MAQCEICGKHRPWAGTGPATCFHEGNRADAATWGREQERADIVATLKEAMRRFEDGMKDFRESSASFRARAEACTLLDTWVGVIEHGEHVGAASKEKKP